MKTDTDLCSFNKVEPVRSVHWFLLPPSESFMFQTVIYCPLCLTRLFPGLIKEVSGHAAARRKSSNTRDQCHWLRRSGFYRTLILPEMILPTMTVYLFWIVPLVSISVLFTKLQLVVSASRSTEPLRDGITRDAQIEMKNKQDVYF